MSGNPIEISTPLGAQGVTSSDPWGQPHQTPTPVISPRASPLDACLPAGASIRPKPSLHADDPISRCLPACLQERVLGRNHPSTLMTRAEFAHVLHELGQSGQAREQLEELVVLCAERLGDRCGRIFTPIVAAHTRSWLMLSWLTVFQAPSHSHDT